MLMLMTVVDYTTMLESFTPAITKIIIVRMKYNK